MAFLRLAFGASLVLGLYIIQKLLVTRHKLPLPPGPKGLPLVGNIRDLPPKDGSPEWQHWIKHRNLYGPISSVTVFGQTIVLLHDKEAAFELLEKRAAKYSSRPWMTFAFEMVGYQGLLGFQPYNKNLREQRKLAAGQIGSKKAVARFHSAIDVEVRRFMLRTLRRPDNFIEHLQKEAGTLMLEMLYGYTPSPDSPDPLVDLVNKVMTELSEASVPGAWLVDFVPWLRHLPTWMPGAGFKQTARNWNQDFISVVNVPIKFVKQQMSRGAAKHSYVSSLLKEKGPVIKDEESSLVSYSASSLYTGGADTTVAALSFFFLAMTIFPEVQTKAREEMERVIGGERLPGFLDRDKLPYIEAVVKETLRWQPIATLGVAHRADAEDKFRGYRIPKGALILPSIKYFSQDPVVYRDPQAFRPERFLEPEDEPSPYTYAFGFGRRICPGRVLADASLFLTIAQSLAVFEISKAVDEETGGNIEPVLGVTPGLVTHPLPFRCRIMARTKKHVELIRRVEVEHAWPEGDARFLSGLAGY